MQLADVMFAIDCPHGEAHAEVNLLMASMQRWGGRLSKASQWVCEIPEDDTAAQSSTTQYPLSPLNPQIPTEIHDFPFAHKIFAAAEAEKLALSNHMSQLIWFDTDTLILHEPLDLLLKEEQRIACTPVHIKNISSSFDEPMDDYWSLIYNHCGASSDSLVPITTMIDRVNIRPHFNAGLISLRPEMGIFRRWQKNFESLVTHPHMKSFYQQDRRYRLYLHQASLAGTILSMCNWQEIKILPPTYNYPLHLVSQVEATQRPASLDQLTTARYDNFTSGNLWALPVKAPYDSWLKLVISPENNK